MTYESALTDWEDLQDIPSLRRQAQHQRRLEYIVSRHDLLDALVCRRAALERAGGGLPGEAEALDNAIARMFSRT